MKENQRKSRMREGNYYVVQSFMVTSLRLKGLELACYAIIHGFSQDGNQWFNGSLQYLSDWTGASKQAVMTALRKMVEKGLLSKRESSVNGVKSVSYRSTYLDTIQETCIGGMQETCTPLSKKLDGGMQETCPNKIVDTINDNITGDTKDKREDKKDKALCGSALDNIANASHKTKERNIKPNFWSLSLIDKGYVLEESPFLDEYNDLLDSLSREYDINSLAKALSYFLSRFNGKDENGEEIIDRFSYLKKSLRDGLDRLYKDKNNLDDVMESVAKELGMDS